MTVARLERSLSFFSFLLLPTGELAAAAGASTSRCVRGAQGRPGRGALGRIFTHSGRREVTVEQTAFVGLEHQVRVLMSPALCGTPQLNPKVQLRGCS